MVAGKVDQSVQMGVQREPRAGRERMKERENNFKIESNLRKSWQHAESVLAPMRLYFLFFPFQLLFQLSGIHMNAPIRRVGTRAVWIQRVAETVTSDDLDRRSSWTKPECSSALKRSANNDEISLRDAM